jgi:hypothetical protein
MTILLSFDYRDDGFMAELFGGAEGKDCVEATEG